MDDQVAKGMDDRYMAFIGWRPAVHPKFENIDIGGPSTGSTAVQHVGKKLGLLYYRSF